MCAKKLFTSCDALFNAVLTHRFCYMKLAFCREYCSSCTVTSLLTH